MSSVGGYVDRFERMTAEYVGTKYAVATVGGTAALHISLMLAGVEAEDEVLVSTPAHQEAGSASCPIADSLYAEALSLPCSVGLARSEQDRVIEAIKTIV